MEMILFILLLVLLLSLDNFDFIEIALNIPSIHIVIYASI